MLAAVYRGRNSVAVEEWPAPPAPPPGWVTIAVSHCGICGTDLDEIANGPVYVPSVPLVLGHEAAGTVVAEGGNTGLDVGTRVALENSVGCFRCERCLAGSPHLCQDLAVMGLMLDGALAERVNVPASMCVPLSERLAGRTGALAEPLAVAVRAVRRAGDVRGADLQVVGGGTIGLLAAQVARAGGARSVVVRERSPHRRRVAADLRLEAAGPDEEVPRSSIVIECTGSPGGFQTALAATAKGGTTVVVGIHAQPQPLDLKSLLLDERSVVASLSHSLLDDFVPAVAMLEDGRIEVEPLVTDEITLDRVVADGFDRLLNEPDGHLKILVSCGGSGT